MKELNNLSLADIAPSSIANDKNISAIIEALNPDLKLVTDSINQEFIYSRIDELDSGVLDILAWQFHVDFYDLAKDINAKRRQVKDSILWHMKKGTAWAVLKALDMIGVDAQFINWYEFGGEPYTFRIKANVRPDFYNYGDKEKLTQNIIRAINEAKSTRSFLVHLDTYLNDSDKNFLFAGIAQGTGGLVAMLLSRPESPEQDINFSGIGHGISGYERVNLSRPSEQESKIYAAMAEGKNYSFSLGVDFDIMNELLAGFEARIFDRLEQQEERIMTRIDLIQQENNLRFDEILDLLRWEDSHSSIK